MSEFIKCEVADHIAVVTMDAPPVNAQGREFHDQLAATFDRIGDREDVRVVIITGAGKVFSAGADIRARRGIGAEPGDRWAHSRRARESG